MSLGRDLGPLVGAIDQGTSSTRFFVFSASTAELVTYHQIPLQASTPRPGWAELDPLELVDSVRKCIKSTVNNLIQLDVDPADIVAIGITNQRETTIVWDKVTGRPLYNAILWHDNRTHSTEQMLLAQLPRTADMKFFLQPHCGLPLSTYFSAVKLRWLLDNVPAVAQAAEEDRLCFGTVDSWLIWNLTGGARGGGVHVTDVTNASRTMLMNIEKLEGT